MPKPPDTITREEWLEHQRTGKIPARLAGVATPEKPPADAPPNKAEFHEEEKIHKMICQELNRREVAYIHAPMNKKSTLPVGWPDFTIFPAGGKTWFAEIKTATGKLSKEQEATKAKLEADKYPVYIPRSFEEFMAIFKDRQLWQDSTPIQLYARHEHTGI